MRNDTGVLYERAGAVPNGRSGAGSPSRWLFLIHQLPPKPDYLRVKIRRRLARCGAALIKASVYALPHNDQALEDFEWVRREIAEMGGEAVVCATQLIAGLTDAELTAMFEAERNQAYREIDEQAAALLAGAPADPAAWRATAAAMLSRLRRRFSEIGAVDFFGASGRSRAEDALMAVEYALAPEARSSSQEGVVMVERGRTWVTRQGVKVDRMASAWLIRRFIDADAEFVFVNPEAYVHVPGHLRFDMFEGEFTHELDRCTFETLLAAHALGDAGLRALSEIVHDIDCKDTKFDRPECAGVAALVDGIVAAHDTDAARIAAASVLLDALHLSLGRSG